MRSNLPKSLQDYWTKWSASRYRLKALRGLFQKNLPRTGQQTIQFLQIISVHWPQIVAQEGLVSPIQSRTSRLDALAAQWKKTPPPHPVIAAGTTGSVPATADLLAVIAALPNGAIVLPGFDTQSDEAYFEQLGESHPQWGMKQLLLKLKYERVDVLTIGKSFSPRVQLLTEVMRPAEVSGAWQHLAR